MERIFIIKDSDGVLLVNVKAQKNWALILFLAVWLSFWTFGGITSVIALISGSNRDPLIFFWLCGWAGGETLGLVIWLWTLVGQETISIERGVFSHKREIFGRGVTRVYAMNELFNLRVSGPFGKPAMFSRSYDRYGLTGGTVTVDTRYGDSCKFGINLEEDDAQLLVNLIRPYFDRNATVAFSES